MIKPEKINSYSRKGIFCFFLLLISFSNLFSKENILILRPIKIEYRAIEKGINQYFGENFNIVTQVNCDNSTSLKKDIAQYSPVAIVIMDADLILELKKSLPLKNSNIPIFTVLKTPLRSSKFSIKNSYSFNYETPFSVYAEKLEKNLKISIKKVGVIHSNNFNTYNVNEYINDNKDKPVQLFAKEIINSANTRNMSKEIEESYKELYSKHKVDAILLLEDRSLFLKEIIERSWKPLANGNKIPIIVPTKTFLSDDMSFGTINISANLKVCGQQLGSLINDVRNNKKIKKNHRPISYVSYIKNVLGKTTSGKISYGSILPYNDDKGVELGKSEMELADNNESEDTTNTRQSIDTIAFANKKGSAIIQLKKVNKQQRIVQTVDNNFIEEKTLTENDNSKKEKQIKEKLPEEIIQSAANIPEFSGKYVKISVYSHPISPKPDGSGKTIGTAKSGDIFPILKELPQAYKIQYFSQIGYIDRSSGEIIISDESNTDLLIYSIIGSSAIVAILLITIILLIFKRKKMVIPQQKSCLVITNSKKKILLNSESKKKISLKKVFKKLGYHVEVTNDLAHVNKVLLYYLPEIICIDWRFTMNIRQIIYNMLSERSFNSNVNIIFYNTVHSKSINGKNRFTNSTHYFGDNMTMENIHEIAFPSESTNHYKSLEGKIENNNLVEILQLLDNSKKTGSLYIEKDNHPYGVIFVSNGLVIYSATETLHGEEAVFNILSLHEGMFHFVDGKLPRQNNMNIAVMQVLMYHVKQIDEAELPKISF